MKQFKFQQFGTTQSFGKNIFAGKITLNDADKDQCNLLIEIVEFNKKRNQETQREKKRKRDTYESINALYEGREMVFNTFKKGIFMLPRTKDAGLKMLTLKQLLQRLPIALTQAKAPTK